ncbi:MULTISPECIES: transketolase [unclassified Paracoccus (in: a-proteobacteria)]|uniref:transketolase n=1 Tax=unclassified Paracoccus (in: a-proteobacteria) TaxID=2688777 RepID=UPI0012B2F260|nr:MULTISPECIES: transketolase [unclassified Paracoccus (in: a-proteobacteria)]UXU74689.1 transketolase [Paracoccus sp. SMMA_5]UXU80585.1 transketolase [Paracoccus sp. SMMA_5_TC]
MDFAARRKADPAHWRLATAIRVLSMDAVEAANSGHPGMPMGMADVATVLFRNHLKFDAAAPHWFDRDRFVLSAGHGSMLIYSLLYLTGYEQMSLDQIRNFRQWGSITAGHPEYGHAEGVETTTGPLGQGIATAVGMAIAEEAMRAQFGAELCDHKTWVIAGDGCLMEGISQEAIALAGHQKLKNLIVLWDNNDITIDGRVSLSDSTDQLRRFEASGWRTLSCDGHDAADIDRALADAASGKDDRPVLVACKTIIGFGAPKKQDTSGAHGSPLGAEEIAAARQNYGWDSPAFVIPDDILAEWRQIGARGRAAREAWNARVDAAENRDEFARRISGAVSDRLAPAIAAVKQQALADKPKVATRKASEMVLEAVNAALPETIGGSADLTGSNNTKTRDLGSFTPENRSGRYIYYGIREHGMAAAMNGIWLHGGLRPYGGTFMCFTDYARGAMRLSALMGLPVTYVMTHDSIGLGEDGPTHQPVEHLAICRATPNTLTLRPCDLIETAEAWEIALTSESTPAVLALSRQNLPTLRQEAGDNLTARGAYVLREASAEPKAILMASGSEVEIAVAARDLLEQKGIPTRVVSVPSMELFRDQDEAYRRQVLPKGPVRVAVEAAVRQPWDWLLLGERGKEKKAGFVGMIGFGASAPAPTLYKEFGITAEAVAAEALRLLD